MAITKQISIQLDLYSKQRLIINNTDIVQDDIGNILNIWLLAKRIPFDISNCTVYIVFYKSDNTSVEGNVSIVNASNGMISYTMGTNEIASIGTTIGAVIVTDSSNNRLTWQEFQFNVRKDYESNAVSSSTDLPILKQLINETQTAVDNTNSINQNFSVYETYNSSKQYQPLNKVSYNGSSYECIIANQGIVPSSDVSKWLLIASKGTDGYASILHSTFTATSNNTSHIVHGLDYDPTHDTLVVKEGQYNTELSKQNNEYTENSDKLSIDLVGWTINTGDKINFDLYKCINDSTIQSDINNAITAKTNLDNSTTTAIATKIALDQSISSGQLDNKIKVFKFTATSNNTTHIVHNLNYNPIHDDLNVIYNGSILDIDDSNYTENSDNISIDLVGWTLNNGERIKFKLFKNVK